MKNDEFLKIVDKQLNYCIDLLELKNKEYQGSTADRFHSFKVAAELQGGTPIQALAGMMAKHSVSLYDMCRSGNYTLEKWTEKITDSINYLLILKAMLEEAENERLRNAVRSEP